MECGSYRAVKLLEHGMKVLEGVLEKRLRQKVKIDDMGSKRLTPTTVEKMASKCSLLFVVNTV